MAVAVSSEHSVYRLTTSRCGIFSIKKLTARFRWEMDKEYRCVYREVRISKPTACRLPSRGLVAENRSSSAHRYRIASNSLAISDRTMSTEARALTSHPYRLVLRKG